MSAPSSTARFFETQAVLPTWVHSPQGASITLVGRSGEEHLSNVFIAKSCRGYFDDVVQFAFKRGLLDSDSHSSLFSALRSLAVPREKRVLLMRDFAPYSFSFQTYRLVGGEWRDSYNGGLIYYGAGDTGVDAPNFSVRIGPDLPEGWSINT